MADKAHRDTDKQLARMERRLKWIYSNAQADIEAKAAAYFKQFEEADEKKRAELREKKALLEKGKITLHDYRNAEGSYRRWRTIKLTTGEKWKRQKALMATEYANAAETALAYINGELPEAYAIGYNLSAANIMDASDLAISYELANRDTVRILATSEKILLPYKELDLTKETAWVSRNINNAVLQGIIQGEPVSAMAKRLRRVSNMSYNSSMTNARTMVTSAENMARQEASARADKRGIIMGKAWYYVHDKNVRAAHSQAGADYPKDKAIPYDDPFIVDGEELMYPGDDSGSPHNIYGCRCTLVEVVLGFRSTLPPEKRGTIKVKFDEQIGSKDRSERNEH